MSRTIVMSRVSEESLHSGNALAEGCFDYESDDKQDTEDSQQSSVFWATG